MSRLAPFVAFSLLIGFASPGTQGAEQQPTLQELKQKYDELQRKFPARTEAEKFYLNIHCSPQPRLYSHPNKENILLITWISEQPGVAYNYVVCEKGRVYSEIHIYNWAVQASGVSTVKKGQLKTLQASISKLPKSTARPPYNRTVYVSFHDNKDWRTEAYDSAKLPLPLEAVIQIIGERSETRKRKKTNAK